MTQEQMRLLIPGKLAEIEKEYGIHILYAAESGSRAWGTCSEQSDYDVRFIYIRPREDYLRLAPLRDVLEFPIADGWDMCGWDLRKTLQLLHNSNTQIYEWLHSPVVYADDGFSERIRPVLDACFSTRTGTHHYLHQTGLKWKKIQKTEEPKVKHYLYTLQYLPAARWVMERKCPPPVHFQTLADTLPGEIRKYAYDMLRRKTQDPEHRTIDRIPELEQWLDAEQETIRQEISLMPAEQVNDWDMLDRFFLSELDRR